MPKSPRKSKPLHIGIDARLAYKRGVGTYTANLILALARVDKTNRYSLFNAPRVLLNKIKSPRFRGMEVPVSNPAYYEQFLLPKVARENGMDFLHYTDNSGTTLTDFPYVLTLHDTFHLRPLGDVRPRAGLWYRLVYAYKRWANPRSAEKARAIVTVSEFSKKCIVEEMSIAPERITVTLEGVDRALFPRVVRKSKGLFKILVHGAADERKNIPNILKTAKLLVERGLKFQMVILGMDQKELKSTHYLEEAINLGIGDRLEWAGNVPMDLLAGVYGESDLFLFPSKLEGFGLPVLEAFACGLPVVTSNSSALPEVAGNAALLVDPEDPKAMARAVERVMKSSALRRSLIQKGLKRAGAFSWDRTARETLKVYEKVGKTLKVKNLNISPPRHQGTKRGKRTTES